jgi:hypothetical protein
MEELRAVSRDDKWKDWYGNQVILTVEFEHASQQ